MASEVKFMSFSSGSCGNCYLLVLEEEGMLVDGVIIDAGVSVRRLKKELALKGYDFDSFSAVLVTHDHLDHIRNLGSYCHRLKKPVYATATLHRALAEHSFTRDHIADCRRILSDDGWTTICPGRIFARYFVVPHDATQTVGYALLLDGYKFVIMTDIGDMTGEALAYARNAQTVVIESNFDEHMLLCGPYPYELKMRIIQGCGHLSNSKCAQALGTFWHSGLKQVFLCHLSENNNTPELAFRASASALADLGFKPTYDKSPLFEKDGESLTLRTLPRETASPLFRLI